MTQLGRYYPSFAPTVAVFGTLAGFAGEVVHHFSPRPTSGLLRAKFFQLDRAISELVARFVWWCWWVRELFSPRHQFKTRSLWLQVVSCLISTGCVSLGSTRANPGAVPSPRVAPLSFAILACSLRVSLSRPTRHPSCGNLLLQLNRYPGQHEALAKSQRTHPLCHVL